MLIFSTVIPVNSSTFIFYITHKIVRNRKDIHAISDNDMKIQGEGVIV